MNDDSAEGEDLGTFHVEKKNEKMPKKKNHQKIIWIIYFLDFFIVQGFWE